ncbi:Acetyltransferase [Stackebrandtia soli]
MLWHSGAVTATIPPTQLTLRPWRPGDAGAVLAAFAGSDMATQSGEPIIDLAGARRWLDWPMSLAGSGTGYAFAVTLDADEPVANVALSNIDRHGCGWVSYWTAERVRGRGIASSALVAAVAWWHDIAGIPRLELGYRLNNPGSASVAASAGFIVEGRQRGKLCYDGVRYDVETAARLDADPRPAARHPSLVIGHD